MKKYKKHELFKLISSHVVTLYQKLIKVKKKKYLNILLQGLKNVLNIFSNFIIRIRKYSYKKKT